MHRKDSHSLEEQMLVCGIVMETVFKHVFKSTMKHDESLKTVGSSTLTQQLTCLLPVVLIKPNVSIININFSFCHFMEAGS